jgi:phosphatidylserine/phosphatidylglycerophosphate/cardiolipin synthase-like enzyme
MRRLALFAAAMTLTPTPSSPLSQEPVYAGVRVFYGPSSNFESIDARLIESAARSIDMAAYVLTDRAVVVGLGRAAMRGVRVRIYLDGEGGRGAQVIDQIASTPNVEIRRKAPSRDLMHLKSYQVDGRVLRTGSANFSVSGDERQDNDLIVIESPAAVAAFRDAFERLWARADNQRIGFR